jgi:hypothetical protein
MLRWSRFAEERPDLADAGRALLYQFGVGLGFLATVGVDSSPRVHPVCPVLSGGGLYLRVIPSPKRSDLERNGRYALHSFPRPDDEDAFYLTGRAEAADEEGLRREVLDVFLSERAMGSDPPGSEDERLFELLVGRAMLTRTTGHGDYQPSHVIWHHRE